MAKAKLIQKKVVMSNRDIIKYQLLTHCFTRQIRLSNSELDCITLLAALGEIELSQFCNITVDEKIFKTAQTVRNFLTKASKINLVNKKGTNKKKILLHKDLQVETKGNIILDYKMYHVTQEQ